MIDVVSCCLPIQRSITLGNLENRRINDESVGSKVEKRREEKRREEK
jgi:hypothetical protein